MPRKPGLTPAQRALRARLAALASHAGHDAGERTAPMQGRSPQHLGYWVTQVRAAYPDLGDAEVTRRADLLHRAHMARLGYRSSRARAARKAAGQ